MEFRTRNTTIGFAQRTHKNLEYVRNAWDRGEDVHVVTNLVNSLLGIVIVPKERLSGDEFSTARLEDLSGEGWPTWNITLDRPPKNKTRTETLDRLVEHLRNAAAHGRFWFSGSPDSRDLSEVRLNIHDAPGKDAPVNWKADIGGLDLYRFCCLLASRIEEKTGD